MMMMMMSRKMKRTPSSSYRCDSMASFVVVLRKIFVVVVLALVVVVVVVSSVGDGGSDVGGGLSFVFCHALSSMGGKGGGVGFGRVGRVGRGGWVLLRSTDVSPTTTTMSTSTSTSMSMDGERIRKVGGGIPVIESGGCRLFDPALEGKLGGTGTLEERVARGRTYQYLPPKSVVSSSTSSSSTTSSSSPSTTSSSSMPSAEILSAQHWLEDIGLPLNFAKPTKPETATVLGRVGLIDDDAPGDIQHIMLRLPGGMHYVEGQSLSVIPPGIDDRTGKPHKPRLYSIASTRYGDVLDGRTVSLCVRRAEYVDPETGRADPTKAGVCSNFLCDARPGQAVQVAGPVGKTMTLPPADDRSTDIIMVATGTGIAPFRAFLHRLYMERTVARHMYTGTAWLVLGVPTTGGLLYREELEAMQRNAMMDGTSTLEIDYAISREQLNSDGGKMYVQHVLQDRIDVLLQRLEDGAHIYFCGLKGMMPGILDALEESCKKRHLDFQGEMKRWMSNHQWHVEVY